MVNKEIVEYIKNNKGISEDELLRNLEAVGWAKDDITSSIFAYNNPNMPLPKENRDWKSGWWIWDTFQYILQFLSLYILAISFSLLVHSFIDKWVPRINTSYGNGIPDLYLIRGYMAALFVSWPLFTYFFLDIVKRTKNNPHMRTLWSRKILIYLTLIATFIIVVFEVITIIYSFLSGDISINLMLHFLLTIWVSLIIFIYYLNQIKEDRKLYA